MKSVAYITNAGPYSGVGHRAERIQRILTDTYRHQIALKEYTIDGSNGVLWHEGKRLVVHRTLPGILGSKTVSWLHLGLRLRSHLGQFPGLIWHATNQTLSFIITRQRPAVVTVHDLIELLEPQSRWGGIASQYLYSGIRQAAQVIAVSHYTARTIRERLNIPAERITVIHDGVGGEFHPMPDFKATIGYATLAKKLHLSPNARIVLYVGSDHPRKNVITALRAYSRARENNPELVFVKVGEAGIKTGRMALLQEIDRLHLREQVHLLGSVSWAALNELYNAAALLLYPSRFEGFGLPPLQAMAAGTPVITSNVTSLPEVVGDAGIMHDPLDIAAYAASVERLLNDPIEAGRRRELGLARAKQFSWEKAAAAEVSVYDKLN